MGREVIPRREAGSIGATNRDGIDVVAAGVRVAREELIVRGRGEVDAPARLVEHVVDDDRLAIERRRDVGVRVHVQDVERDGILRGGGNPVAGDRHAAGGEIDQRGSKIREVAGALQFARHGGRRGVALLVPEAFVVPEEQQTVLRDRPADGAAELVLLEGLDLLREVVARVERVVAEEFVQVPVELIATRSGHDTRGGAAGAPVLRWRALRQDAELGDRLDREA